MKLIKENKKTINWTIPTRYLSTNKKVGIKGHLKPNQKVKKEDFVTIIEEKFDEDLKNKGDFLCETVAISIDPYIRCRLNPNSFVEYAPSFQPHKEGSSPAISKVVKSRNENYKEGQYIYSFEYPWVEKKVWNEDELKNRLHEITKVETYGIEPSYFLGVLGMPGMTSYFGIKYEGQVKDGQVLVISGAAGAVGSTAGQIAKIFAPNINLIGIAGTEEKREWLTKILNFDESFVYKQKGWEDQMKKYLIETSNKENSVNVYFDNVGGSISEKIIPHMDTNGKVILCGQIADYEETDVYPPPISSYLQSMITSRKIQRNRYLVLNYLDKINESSLFLMDNFKNGRLIIRETRSFGIESIPSSFYSVMNGGNIGKQIVII